MKASGAGKTVQQSWFIQTEKERSSILQAAFILWDLSIQGVGGRRAGSESLCLHISFCTAPGVTMSAIVLLDG